jgi:hypothetical protein
VTAYRRRIACANVSHAARVCSREVGHTGEHSDGAAVWEHCDVCADGDCDAARCVVAWMRKREVVE